MMFGETLLTTKTYNIFISHSWAYSDNYDRLTKLLRDKPGFYFNDFSVPKDDPIHYAQNDAELYQAIKQRIQQSDVVLMLAGVYSTYSKWINLEIRAAKESGILFGKPIIAIEPFGSERTSTTVKDNANEIVKWNTDSVTKAIKDWSFK